MPATQIFEIQDLRTVMFTGIAESGTFPQNIPIFKNEESAEKKSAERYANLYYKLNADLEFVICTFVCYILFECGIEDPLNYSEGSLK